MTYIGLTANFRRIFAGIFASIFSTVASNSSMASLFQLIVQLFLIVTVISYCNLIGGKKIPTIYLDFSVKNLKILQQITRFQETFKRSFRDYLICINRHVW